MIETPEADDSTKRMDVHAMTGDKKSSWVVICKTQLEDSIREQATDAIFRRTFS